MLDLNSRRKLVEQKKTEKLFSSLSSSLSGIMSKNQSDLEGKIEKAVTGLLEKESKEFRVTKGEEFYIDLVKFLIKRMDIQIMLLMEIHKDLKRMEGKNGKT